ncbi:hypothetical protein Dimus_016947 [Dionaea muscipula]
MDLISRPPCSLRSRSIKIKFACRFLQALKKINEQRSNSNPKSPHSRSSSSSSLKMISRRYKRVRMAADASMASAVGRRKAWSRAMILKLRTKRHAVLKHAPPAGVDEIGYSASRRIRRAAACRRKANVVHKPDHDPSASQEDQLRRLVPGGEAMDLCSLLDETAHYIKCLATKVIVMRSIVSYCSST